MRKPLLILLFFSFSQSNAGPTDANIWVHKNCSLNRNYYFCENIEYKKREEKSLKLDLYLPQTLLGQTKMVMMIHGGCFYLGDKADVKTDAIRLVNNGFAVASVNYTLAQDKAYPAAFEDVKDSVAWLKQEALPKLQIRENWLSALGYSAGATLAGYLGTRSEPGQSSPYVNSVVHFYGRTDFTLPPIRKSTLDKDADDCPSIFAGKQDPLTKIKSSNIDRKLYASMNVAAVEGVTPASFFIAHTIKDDLVDVEHAHLLFKNLLRAGGSDADLELHLAPGLIHGFTKQSEPIVWKKAIHFLKTH